MEEYGSWKWGSCICKTALIDIIINKKGHQFLSDAGDNSF